MANDDYIKRSDALKAILGLSIYDTLEELDGVRTIGENTWADGLYDAYKVIDDEVDEVVVDPTQRWIPVTERLPETRRFVPHGPISSSKVLFKTTDKTIHLGYLIKDSYVDKYAGETILQRWYDDHGDRIENVTKWCEPPKEDSDATY